MRDAIAGELTAGRSCSATAGTSPTSATTRGPARRCRAGAAASLLIMLDEFTELLTAKPDFIDMFLAIGRLGRSLGVHLCLASQRLEEGKLRGLDSHLSYRVGLKTFSAAESRTVLGVPDAYELPPSPARVSSSSTPRWCGSRPRTSPARTWPMQRSPSAAAAARRRPVLFTAATRAGAVRRRRWPAAPGAGQPAADDALADTVLDVMVADDGPGPAGAHGVAAAAGRPPTLDQLLPRLGGRPDRGLRSRVRRRGWLIVPVGMVDRPFDQRRDPLYGRPLRRGRPHVSSAPRRAARAPCCAR